VAIFVPVPPAELPTPLGGERLFVRVDADALGLEGQRPWRNDTACDLQLDVVEDEYLALDVEDGALRQAKQTQQRLDVLGGRAQHVLGRATVQDELNRKRPGPTTLALSPRRLHVGDASDEDLLLRTLLTLIRVVRHPRWWFPGRRGTNRPGKTRRAAYRGDGHGQVRLGLALEAFS
jgi:hypothetical protein